MKAFSNLPKAALLVCAIAGAPFSHAAIVLKDDFETTGLITSLTTAIWTTTKNVTIDASSAIQGSRSAALFFEGNTNINDDSHAELRFDLKSQYKELWIQYSLYIPTNYEHRAASPSNNKFFRLWGTDYANKEKVGLSTWAKSDGSSSLTMDWGTSGSVGPKGQSASGFISKADAGKWMTVKIYAKAATASTPGTMKVWKNGQLAIDNTNTVDNYAEGESHSFRYGYFLGWSNSGYDQNTTFKIDNIVMATSESELGGKSTAESVAPSPPSLSISPK